MEKGMRLVIEWMKKFPSMSPRDHPPPLLGGRIMWDDVQIFRALWALRLRNEFDIQSSRFRELYGQDIYLLLGINS